MKDLVQARVLVVDPDSEVLGFVKWALSNAKVAAVRTLGFAGDSLAVIGDFRPDIALIELKMDGLDGVEFIRQVRANAAGTSPNLPIVLMTKSADAEQIHAACEAGLNNIIAKPFTAETLLKRIRTTLTHPDRHIQFAAPPPEQKSAPQPLPQAAPKAAPKPVQPRPAVKPAEPSAVKPREAVKVAPPKKAEPRAAVKPVATGHTASPRARTESEEIFLVDVPEKPPREDVPPVDSPAPPPAPKDDIPLVEPEPETPEEEVDEVAAEIVAIISAHSAWLESAGKSGERASFNGADLAGQDFSGRNLANASFRDADLQDADLDSANLHSADLRGANLSSARLSNADLGQARLRRAVLKAANLSGANLKDADFAGADCTNADFSGADITRANFLGANLAGADLRGEELTQSQLDKAIADATTKLPGGLRLPLSED